VPEVERSVHMLTRHPVAADPARNAKQDAPDSARGGVHRARTKGSFRAPSVDFGRTFMELAPTIRFMAFDREPLPVEFILPGRSNFTGNRASYMDHQHPSAKDSRPQPLLENYRESDYSLTANPPSKQDPISNQTQTEQIAPPNIVPLTLARYG